MRLDKEKEPDSPKNFLERKSCSCKHPATLSGEQAWSVGKKLVWGTHPSPTVFSGALWGLGPGGPWPRVLKWQLLCTRYT